ncbi:MAG: F0F1 ATP synthase subunit B [Actinomycetota bacterium]
MGNTFGLLAAESTDKENLYPHAAELIVGAVAFGVIFFFMWKWVLPRVNTLLEERREKIQGEMEKAEQAHHEADEELSRYKAQLADAAGEANRIIEEARKTADQLRADLQARAEQESHAIVARAQEEIRAERDRVFQELRTQVGEIAVELAGKVVGEELDTSTHTRLIDEYIDQVTSGNGNN